MKSLEDVMRFPVPDFIFFFYIFLLILVAAASCVIFTSFVRSKPDGRKTVIGKMYWTGIFYNICTFLAKVNVAICQVLSCCSIIQNLFILLRLLVGPFSYAGVLIDHYWLRITMVSFLTMLTFKMILTTLFILDFNKMTLIPEKMVMRCMWMVTVILTLAHLGLEIYLRHTYEYQHFGRLCFFLYLGKVGQKIKRTICLIILIHRGT